MQKSRARGRLALSCSILGAGTLGSQSIPGTGGVSGPPAPGVVTVYDTGALAEALITTRDGIVGHWAPPAGMPLQHPGEAASNLARWEPAVRSQIFDFELLSRLGVTAWPRPQVSDKGAQRITLWHLNVDAPADPGGAVAVPPACRYQPLIAFDRPPEAVFQEQLAFMRSYADLRPDRVTEIVEAAPSVVPFMASVCYLRPDAKRWTMELIEVVLQLARYAEQRVKHGLACRRANEYSPQVQPIILTPGHGSLPSGHSAESFAVARVLSELLRAADIASANAAPPPYQGDGYALQLVRMAARIAVNRTVAGVHFPIDSIAGALLGLTLGEYFLARVRGGRYHAAHFDGTAADIGRRDFAWWEIYDPASAGLLFADGTEKTHPAVRRFDGETYAADDSPALTWLWERAVAEWT